MVPEAVITFLPKMRSPQRASVDTAAHATQVRVRSLVSHRYKSAVTSQSVAMPADGLDGPSAARDLLTEDSERKPGLSHRQRRQT